MAKICKLVGQTKIRFDGNVFHQLYKFKPHKISNLSPDIVQSCALNEGQWGTVGSTITWNYTHDGKKEYAKEIIEAVDEEKKLVSFKVIEGDLMKEYKSFLITLTIDTNGKESVVTWTIDYEKLNEDSPEPSSFIDLLLKVAKDIESRHLDN